MRLFKTLFQGLAKPVLRTTIVMVFLFYSCSDIKDSPMTVTESVFLDTKINTATISDKRHFELSDIGVFASNDFEGSRLNGFEKVNDSTVKLFIYPENEPINNSPYYAFETWSDQPKKIFFQFQYPLNYSHRYIPKLKIENKWQQIPPAQIINSDDQSFTIFINLNVAPQMVAAQKIQPSTAVNFWIDSIVQGREAWVRKKNIATSVLDRDITVLDIYKDSPKGKKIIVLLTRQHPPEITGYFAFQYFLETLLTTTELQENFLNEFRIIAFPNINPDGTDMGHWRNNANGLDLNRDWKNFVQPETSAVARYINETDEDVILGLDFHSTYKDVFYTNKERTTTDLPNFITEWFSAIEINIPGYLVNEKASISTQDVSKAWFLDTHKAVGITYEIGDETPKNNIALIGSVSAISMMNILTQHNE
jgi:hypothetical protein